MQQLLPLLCERLQNADSRKRLAQVSRETRHARGLTLKASLQTPPDQRDAEYDERRRQQNVDRELPARVEQVTENPDKRQAVRDQQGHAAGQKLFHTTGVICEARHQQADLPLVEKSQREPLEVAKELGPNVRADAGAQPYAHPPTPDLARPNHEARAEQADDQPYDLAEAAKGRGRSDNAVNDVLNNEWGEQLRQCAGRHDREQQSHLTPVRLKMSNEPA